MTDLKEVNEGSYSPQAQLNWNALFRGDHAMGAYNACVGNNGSPNIYFYADGFADSVDLLIDNLTKGHSALLDTLIYPICFSLRHSVELTLKGQIQELCELAKLRERPLASDTDIEKVLNQHDIMNLWVFFTGYAVAFDRRYKEQISSLDPLIRCIAETDPTGQTFRYSYSTEAKKHLTDVSVINVLVLREQFRIICDNLEKLRGLSQWLWREYSTGSFTGHLSRKDLQDIAGRLPPRQTWADPSAGFDSIKSSIKSEYNIGSKELSKAITKIQNSKDLARIIGLEVKVPGLSAGDLNALNDFWKLAWHRDALADELRKEIAGIADSPIVPVNLLQELDFEVNAMKDAQSSLEQFMLWATEERLAGLQALLDASLYRFSEEYDNQYEMYKKEVMTAFSGSSRLREAEITEIWTHSIGRRGYPSRVIGKLKLTGFEKESAELEENLFS